ncbi:myosin-2 heavy chain isoform X2 [Hyalella azteca]|uniref:Myosin-2 heavy chain isoform X2 n=1 Tax=Hyalella azteca TaxID=294128 RepID=A0A8B7MYE2_HYAAZ|nr:myosin-2 heavy chain isoform X2 [Hyalella azteca]
MTSSHTEKSKGCLLSGLCWLLGAGLKVSVLVVLLALLASVHQLRTDADDASLKLEIVQRELLDATTQKQEASQAFTNLQTELNQLQTNLATSRQQAQDLQVQLSKKLDLQRDLDRASQEAKSAKQKVLVLEQKIQELEAAERIRKLEEEKGPQSSAVVQALESEKQQLLKKVSDLEVVIEQGSVNTIAAAENEKKLTEELKQTLAKFAQSEKNNEMLLAKAKGQDKKIEELSAKIKQLEDAKKSGASASLTLKKLVSERDEAQQRLDIALKEKEQLGSVKAVLEEKLVKVQKELEKVRIETRPDYDDVIDRRVLIDQRDTLLAEKTQLMEQLQQLAAAGQQPSDGGDCTAAVAQEKLNTQKLLEIERKTVEVMKSDMEHTVRYVVEDLDKKDQQINELTLKLVDVKKKWIESDHAASQKIQSMQKEKKDFEAAMRQMLQDLDVKDDLIKTLTARLDASEKKYLQHQEDVNAVKAEE